MGLRYRTISFLSDYGHDDEFVGVVHSVVRSLAPDVAVIDISHNIAPYDVRGGGLLLARAAQYLVPGVVLAVVDPGVASARRAIAVELGDGVSVLVGPDNGLLAPAVALCGGATRAVSLTNADYHLPAAGPTFAGRDILAPAAAHLCLGVALDELGDAVDPHSLTPAIMPVARFEGDAIAAEVLWVDRYGNAQLNVEADDLAPLGPRLRVHIGDRSRAARRVQSFTEIGPGAVGLIVDSYGLIALAVDRGSAAVELGVAAGDQVRIDALGGDSDGGRETPIRLAKKGTL